MVTATRVTVTSAATLIFSSERRQRLIIRNRGLVAVSIGASGVTAATGFDLDPGTASAGGDAISLDVEPNDLVYGITPSSTAVVHVLYVDID